MSMTFALGTIYSDKKNPNFHFQGVPIMIRIGAADRTVHPYYTRRMFRLLRQQRTNVTYSEIADKEHWWWDTYKTNDGGVVNDPVIRNFAVIHAQNAAKLSSPASKTFISVQSLFLFHPLKRKTGREAWWPNG